MTARFFVDTNVLVYAASNAAADRARRELALQLLDRSDLALSAQVLAEFYSVATSKAKLNMTHDEAAKRMGCAVVYSEDLNAGQDYDGVTVVNPFAGATP